MAPRKVFIPGSAFFEREFAAGVPHPNIITARGRAIAAYHAVLVFGVLGVSSQSNESPPDSLPDSVENAENEHGVIGGDRAAAFGNDVRVRDARVVANRLNVVNDVFGVFLQGVIHA